LTADDLLAGRAIKDAPLALGEDTLNQRHNRKNGYERLSNSVCDQQ